MPLRWKWESRSMGTNQGGRVPTREQIVPERDYLVGVTVGVGALDCGVAVAAGDAGKASAAFTVGGILSALARS